MEVKGLTESSRRKLAEAQATFISVDNVRALVTLGELDRYKEVHEIVLPKFDKEYTEACVMEREGYRSSLLTWDHIPKRK